MGPKSSITIWYNGRAYNILRLGRPDMEEMARLEHDVNARVIMKISYDDFPDEK